MPRTRHWRLAREANKVIVAKGKKVVTFDMKKDPPDDATLLAHLIGPTGNLRAPAIFKGKTLLIGFNDEAYRDGLGDLVGLIRLKLLRTYLVQTVH